MPTVLSTLEPPSHIMTERFRDEYEITLALLKLQARDDPESKIFDNQKSKALEIKSAIESNSELSYVNVFSPMQSGKTGVIIQTAIEFVQLGYSFSNQIILSGLSDKQWLQQTTKRLPYNARDKIKVLHRPQILKHNHIFENLKNAIIFIDESHCASEEDMTLYKMFKKFGFDDHAKLQENNIKIITVSATPDAVYESIKTNPDNTYMTVNFKPAPGYNGLKEYLERGQIKDASKLIRIDKNGSILTRENKIALNDNVQFLIDNFYAGKGNKYHMFRIDHGINEAEIRQLFTSVFGETINILWWCDKKADIDFDILKREPAKHTFIILKERCRQAKTLHKKYLGVMYDRIPNMKYNGILSQSLPGRCCGYYRNDDIIIFTDMQSIKNYIQMSENGWCFNAQNYKSKTVTYTQGNVKSINTYIGTGNDGITMGQTETNQKEFDTFEEMKKFIQDHITRRKGSGPRNKTLEDNKTVDGFYVHHEDTIKKVRKYDDVKNNKRGLSSKSTEGKSSYRWIPCYKDITDKNTLVFVLIYTI